MLRRDQNAPTKSSRGRWQRVNARLDAVRDHREITVNLATHEFPWDTLNALSFALFRTYAVPSIGVLLQQTGEFTERVQKRYDDTGLLLEEILEHGLPSDRGRSAVRRINQMHGMYDITNDDLRYVLSTFVVVPTRWMDRFGYRSYTAHERTAVTNYYRELGRHMGIRDIPDDYDGFARLLDDYERAHFAYDERARQVADSTLDLMTTFPPNRYAPAWLVRRFSYALMDDPLLDAFHFPRPTRLERRLFLGLMEVRRRIVRRLPARRTPRWTRDMGHYRSYPTGYRIEGLGTFPAAGCPQVGKAADG